ncbi:MAG: hypothetical protein Q7T11_00810 [Deltaproteobacteria bacterium]|nr:hypothetical protein [Deltaproteobacteria bacterium]
MAGQNPICLPARHDRQHCQDNRASVDLYDQKNQALEPKKADHSVTALAAESLQKLVKSAGVPLPPIAHQWSQAKWSYLLCKEPEAKNNSTCFAYLTIPLTGGDAELDGSLRQIITFKAEVLENGEIQWDVKSDFLGTGNAYYVGSLLDSATMTTDFDYFKRLIRGAHLDYAMMVPEQWGNGEFVEGYSNPEDLWFNPVKLALNQDEDEARSILNLFTQTLGREEPKIGDPAQQRQLARVASILPAIPLLNDHFYNDNNFWQFFSYGEIIYLIQLFKDAFTRFQINPQSGLGKLIQRNIDHLRAVQKYMRYDDDHDDEKFDPEVHGTASILSRVHGGPRPPDFTPTFRDNMVSWAASFGIDVTEQIIDQTVPKVEAAIARLKPQLEAQIREITAYLANPENTRELRENLKKRLQEFLPIINQFMDELMKMGDAKLKAQIPVLRSKVDRLIAEIVEKLKTETYPKDIKPMVGELVNILSELQIGGGHENEAPVQEAPGNKESISAPEVEMPGIPREAGKFEKHKPPR